MTSNQKKDEIQANAVELSRLHKCLVLEWATGCGKTLGTFKMIKDILQQQPNATGYLICKESNHLANWIDDAVKHKYIKHLKDTNMLLYASLHKVSKVADYIILDECHALTDKRVDALIRLIGKDTKLIFLSATIPYEKRLLVQRLSKATAHFNTITLIDAINMGLLPEPKVIVHNSVLSNENKGKYIWTMSKGIKSKQIQASCDYSHMWSIFNTKPNMHLSVRCSESQYYQLITDKMQFHYDKSIELGQPFNEKIKHKNLYLNLGSQRKRFIAQVKTEKAKEIIKQFRIDKKRFITFTGSIEQSLTLGANSSVNSKNHKDVNKELIDGFNSKMYSELFAVGMLREGMNLTEIEKGLIIQLDSTIGSFFQMMGRMLRHEFPEIHMIKLEGTQDEKYFEKAIMDFDEKYITYM